MTAAGGQAWETLRHDVLVIGAGGAGLRAAVAVSEVGLSVGVVSKSLLGKAHTVMAEGGVAAALGHLDAEDSPDVHFRDTMKSGHFVNSARMAELLTAEAPERVWELERWGAVFDRTPAGQILQRAFGAHTYRRLCHVGDHTGKELLRTLQNRVTQLGVAFYPEVIVTRLFRDDSGMAGALAYRRVDGRFVLFRAPAIVVATGGWGRVYAVTSNSWESTGDGAALAFAAGADLMDMEMVQFHPTGMVWPPGVRGLLVTEGVRGEGGILLNAQGRRFMADYDPKRMELSSRDVVARAIYQEVQAGRGTPHGGARLDITARGAAFISRKLPSMRAQFLALADVDITREAMEVAPTCHYMMGGVRVDPDTCATRVPGLFAAGEVAAGLHGANRLGGNSLADLLVFGKRAGDAAARFAAASVHLPVVAASEIEEEVARVLAPLRQPLGPSPYGLHSALQEVMTRCGGIVRSGPGLQEGLQQVLEMRERAARLAAPGGTLYNPGWNLALEMDAMLLLGEAILRSALERQESRGAHYRTDFPEEDAAWGKQNVVITRDRGGSPGLRTVPVAAVTPQQQRVLAPLTQDVTGRAPS